MNSAEIIHLLGGKERIVASLLLGTAMMLRVSAGSVVTGTLLRLIIAGSLLFGLLNHRGFRDNVGNGFDQLPCTHCLCNQLGNLRTTNYK